MKLKTTLVFAIGVIVLGSLPVMAKTMTAESLVFCSDLQARSANLLFEPTKILKVQGANQSQVFEEGIDFTVNGRTLELTDDSRIPVLQYFRDTKDSKLYRFKEPAGFIYSPGGVKKHNDYDIEVSYEYAEGDYDAFFKNCGQSDSLHVFERLKKGEPVCVAFLGDSISAGAQASGAFLVTAKPNRPGYTKLVFNALQKHYPDAPMRYLNQSSGGKTTTWALTQAPALAAEKPDLLVLAFGMNDATGARTSSRTYLQNTRKLVRMFREANPNSSILLVAEFSPNPNLKQFAQPALRKANRDGLFALQKELENCAVVDVGSVTRPIVARKKFCDVSGNNVNHPNDFLHQVYADAVLRVLQGSRSSANLAQRVATADKINGKKN